MNNDWLALIGGGVVCVVFVVIELRAPRNKTLKKLERQILHGQ